MMVSTVKKGDKVRLRFRLKLNGKVSTLIANSGDLYDGKLYHVAAVYDGKKMLLFLNGKKVGSLYKVGKINKDLKNSILLGTNSYKNVKNRSFRGLIGDTAIYKKGLTLKEIENLALGIKLVD